MSCKSHIPLLVAFYDTEGIRLAYSLAARASWAVRDIFLFFFIWSLFLAARAHCCLDLICFTVYFLFVDDHSLICSILSFLNLIISSYFSFNKFHSVFYFVFFGLHFIYICFFYLGLLAVCAVHKRFRPCHEEADPLLPFYVVSFCLSNTSFANLLNFSRLCWFSINSIFRSLFYSTISVHL